MAAPRTAEEVWKRYDAMEARLTASLSARMLALAGVRPGMRVLDLATGRGEPAIPAAHAVGPHGTVTGVDLSPAMLAMARDRARSEGIEDARLALHAVDAAAIADVTAPATFDVALARWGLMYMSEPRAALAGVRRALVDGGLLVSAVWVEAERVSYWGMPRALLARVAGVPSETYADDSSGIYRYAPPDALPGDLRAAGFTVEQSEELGLAVMEATTVGDAMDWVRTFGMRRLLETTSIEVQRAWETAMTRELESRRDEDGMIRLGGVTRIVVARAG